MIYGLIIAAYVWMLLAAWVAFGHGAESDLDLSIALVLAVMFFGLPIILRVSATRRSRTSRRPVDDIGREIEVATGPLSTGEVFVQVLLIPFALAFAATMIGAVYLLVH